MTSSTALLKTKLLKVRLTYRLRYQYQTMPTLLPSFSSALTCSVRVRLQICRHEVACRNVFFKFDPGTFQINFALGRMPRADLIVRGGKCLDICFLSGLESCLQSPTCYAEHFSSLSCFPPILMLNRKVMTIYRRSCQVSARSNHLMICFSHTSKERRKF
jgi:hypothetical protein